MKGTIECPALCPPAQFLNFFFGAMASFGVQFGPRNFRKIMVDLLQSFDVLEYGLKSRKWQKMV
jgi:hypothetical protein